MGTTKIEWAERSWNPVTGCTHAGTPGCDHCYAKRMASRLRGRAGYPEDDPFRVTVHEDKFSEPITLMRPSAIFVSSMGDLFHPDVPFEIVARIWRVMWLTERHTFLVLTKRPERMRQFLDGCQAEEPGWITHNGEMRKSFGGTGVLVGLPSRWPLPNVWLGTSVENQEAANIRIPELQVAPAAKKFLSCEPLLGAVSIEDWWKVVGDGQVKNPIDWVICGGESGPGARPMNPAWARSLRDQCERNGVPFFFKQWGAHNEFGKKTGRLLDGREYNERPV